MSCNAILLILLFVPSPATGTERLGTSGQRVITKIAKLTTPFIREDFNNFWGFEIVFGLVFWQASLLCRVGELAGGGAVDVAVSVCDT